MAAQAPTVGQIRTAKSQAVGGMRKRCRKGKNCSAACIANNMACLVTMPESAGRATTNFRNMLMQRMGGKMPAPAAPTPAMMKPSAADQQLKAQAKGILREGKAPVAQTPLRSKPVEVKPKAPEAPAKALGKPVEKRKLEAPQQSGGAPQAWFSKYSGRSEALDAQLNELRAKIGALPLEQQAYWNEQIDKQMNPKLASRNGTPYTPEKTNRSLTSQAKAWNFLISNGPPGELMNRIGEKRPAPKGMIPDVTSSGQRKWISPDDGLKYSLNKGNWRQNRVSKADTDRRLPDITNFRKEQQATGAAWPTQKLPPREGLPKTPAEIIKGLSNAEKNAIVFNGLDATGNEGIKLRAYYNANPAEKEARLTEIVQRWHDQGGRSGVSGKPVALPGLDPKKGEERSSVDHFQPISTNRAAALPASEMRKLADNYKNFLIAEEGPNSQRGARTWDSWLDKRESQGTKAVKPATKSTVKKEQAPVEKTIAKNVAKPTLQELSDRVTQTGKEWARLNGTPQGTAARAEFEKAKADLAKAKQEAQSAPSAAKAASTLESLKQYSPQNYQSARGLKREQDEEVDKAVSDTKQRIDRKLNERQYYDDVTNARIKAANQAIVAPFQKMSDDEKGALALYGAQGVKHFESVNQLLRSGSVENSSPEKVKMAEFISNNLRSGLEKLPPAKVEELGRAVTGNFATSLASLKPGDTITDKGFGSYTNKGNPVYDQFFSKTGPNAAIRILNPKGAREVAPVMEYTQEGEHITLPGTKLRLVDVQEKGVYSRKTGGYIPQYTFEEVE